MKRIFLSSPVKVWIIFLLITTGLNAQPRNDPAARKELFNKIASLDSLLFTAFNTCDLETFQKLLSKDLEFYDDRTGLNASWEKEIESFKGRCGQSFKLRRELVKESLEVYPLDHYGAVQLGDHIFYIKEKDKPEKLDGKAKFIHVWQYRDNEWKITRIISYEHKPAQ